MRVIRISTEIVVADRSRTANGMVTMMRTLVVEDEERLVRRLAQVLSAEGYAAETVGDGRSVRGEELSKCHPLFCVLPANSGIFRVEPRRVEPLTSAVQRRQECS